MPPDDTVQKVLNDPNFHSLQLPEKHKVLLQVDPNYKGLPPKEQAKALDAIHYGGLTSIERQGQEAIRNRAPNELLLGGMSGMSGLPESEHPFQAILNKEPPKSGWEGLKQGIKFGLTPPGMGVLQGAASVAGELLSPQKPGESPEDVEARRAHAIGTGAGAVVPAMMSEAPGSLRTGAGTISKVPRTLFKVGTRMVGLPELGILPDLIDALQGGPRAGMPPRPAGPIPPPPMPEGVFPEEFINKAHAEMQSDIAKGRQQRMAAHAEMEADLADRRAAQIKDLESRQSAVEKARQREITDWAKVGKVEESDHAAFEQRMKEIEDEGNQLRADKERLREQDAQAKMRRGKEQAAMDAAHERRQSTIERDRQRQLADAERLKEQHAAALQAREEAAPAEGETETKAPEAPATARGGGLAPPPVPTTAPETIRIATGIGAEDLAGKPVTERPTIGSEVAARKVGKDIISRTKRILLPGELPAEEPTAAEKKTAGDYTQRQLERLFKLREFGDEFARIELMRKGLADVPNYEAYLKIKQRGR